MPYDCMPQREMPFDRMPKYRQVKIYIQRLVPCMNGNDVFFQVTSQRKGRFAEFATLYLSLLQKNCVLDICPGH